MNKIAACIIVHDDPSLARAVASVRPYVSEVCIFSDAVDDALAAEQAKLADRFERSFDLNGPDGRLADWSKARNRCHAMASQPWVMTLDTDDIVEHGELLSDILAEYGGDEPTRILFPYDYSFDALTGRCTRRQPRVRLVNRPECFEWRKAAHEGLFAKEGIAVRNVYDLRVTVRHTKRDWTAAAARATRIISSEAGPAGEGISDPRDRFDYGMMLAQNGDVKNAYRELTRYVEESGRRDEKAQACLKLAELTGAIGDLATPLEWCMQAHDFSPDAFEPCFKAAALYLVLALTHGGDKGYAREAVGWAKKAIATPLDSLVPYSLQEREVTVYEVWHEAAKVLGDEQMMIEALEAGLYSSSCEPGLLLRWQLPSVGFGRDIVFICGNCEPWNPISVEATGIGGSELAVIAMAKQLAERGPRVRVYVDCGREGLYDGVEYLFPWRLNEDQGECDLLIAWRNAAFLEALPARMKWLWLHDTEAANPTQYRFSLADRILALSEWHKHHLLKTYGKNIREDRIFITRNGIGQEWLDPLPEERDPLQCVYASSPDRGLEPLIAMWPSIRRAVPGAKLSVFYGDAALASRVPWRAKRIRDDLEDLAACGVTNRGKVNQRELAEAMRGAGVWLYPTRFDDTSCILAMNAQAAGLRIVSSRRAALPETIGDAGVLLDGDPDDDEYREAFIREAADAMTRPEDGDRERVAMGARNIFGWEGVAEQWARWLAEDLREEIAAQ